MAAYPELKLLIGGRWRGADAGEPVIDPADGATIGSLPHADQGDLDEAVAAAVAGQRAWSRIAPAEREQIMLKAARLLDERSEEIADAITRDQGRPLADSRAEVATARDRIVWDASEGRRLYGRVIPSRPGLTQTVTRHPLGVVAAFTPWNYPMASPTRKVAGALAAGCSIILKGAEETPAGPYHLVKAFADAGVPDGAVNLVFGRPAEISEYLIARKEVRLITFTGSVPVGKHLAGLAAKAMKPAILELGGNSPAIICADADVELAARLAVKAKSRNAGQVCTSPTRFFVHRSVHDAFVEAFAAGAAALRLGRGHDPDSDMGPLINQRRLDAVQAYVADAVARGARVAAGGKRPELGGWFYPLTVLADVPADALAMIEEPFGPLALVTPFDDLGEAIAAANSVDFALSAFAFTDSAAVIARLSAELECGALAINHFTSTTPEAPFGGAKDSGYGREGGVEGLEGYTYTKTVSQQAG